MAGKELANGRSMGREGQRNRRRSAAARYRPELAVALAGEARGRCQAALADSGRPSAHGRTFRLVVISLKSA